MAVTSRPAWLGVAASRLGLYAAGGQALSGDQLDQIDMSHLQQVINNVSVFYRVSPRHKLKIVKVRASICTTGH